MNFKKTFLLTFSLISALGITSLPVFSCSTNDKNNQLTIIGPDKIYIDQTTADEIIGVSEAAWTVKKGEETIDSNNLFFELIDCDDSNITFSDSRIKWHNPARTNHTFRIKASYVDETTSQLIYGISNEITLFADPDTAKIEFVNENCSFPYNISAQSGKSGQQDGNWVLKFNNNPYSSQKSSIKLINENGEAFNGISIDSNGKISWDDSLASGTYNLYLSAEIVDDITGQTNTVYASNNAIILNVEKAPIYFGSDDKITVSVEACKITEIGRYELFDSNGINITTDAAVSWSLKKVEGSSDYGNNITIQNGIINTTNQLPKGLYKFHAVARKSGLTSPLVSKEIEVNSFVPYVIKGVNDHIIAVNYEEIQETIDTENPWSLYWNDSKMENASFAIVPISNDSEEIERTELLKKSVQIHKIDSTNICLKWDGKLTGGYYNFKIQAKYDNETILSDSITLKSIYQYNSYININGGLKRVSTIKSPAPTSKDEGEHQGKLATPFTVKEKDHTVNIDWNKIEWSFSNTDGVNFGLEVDANDPTKAYLVWDNLEAITFGQNSWITIQPKLTVKYKNSNDTLTDSISLIFNVGNIATPNKDIFFCDGKSYNFNKIINSGMYKGGWTNPGDTLYFNKHFSSDDSIISQGLFDVAWNEPQITTSNTGTLKTTMLSTTSKNAKQRAQFQRFGINYRLPPKSKVSFKLYCKSIFWAGSSYGVKSNRFLARRVDLYNLNTRILPNAIHPYSTIDNPRTCKKSDSTRLPQCGRNHKEDSLCCGSKDRLDQVNTYTHDVDLICEFNPISVVMSNYSDYEMHIIYYIGLSGITSQGTKVYGPDTNLSLDSEFWIKDITLEAI